MNLNEVRYRWRRVFEDGGTRRIKLIGASVLLAVAVVWFGVRMSSMFSSPPRAKEPAGAGWNLARELNEALAGKREFSDTSFSVESENPIKLRLVGAVRTKADLDALHDFVRSLKPDAPPDEIEFDVEIMQR